MNTPTKALHLSSKLHSHSQGIKKVNYDMDFNFVGKLLLGIYYLAVRLLSGTFNSFYKLCIKIKK